ncbi:putative cobaltochelatase [Kineosporia sp. R_H_3]|uniref:putative cobaltochelatase n=1 Tax=Kineosporia sp. R_H_3 TaxID=1961848 RepID=UPI000B4BE9F7|nr:putative cobaltochelatase [Kineosporia sp. R_H_3]
MSGFPFSAVLGMDDLRLALLLNAVSPAIGGVLVRGEKGTAKSTAVRALAALLPPVTVVTGCRFVCDPARPDPQCPDGPHPGDGPAGQRAARLVELPVGAAEDRVAGSLDLERALGEGVKAFEPGLLAAANRGILYVDEVNLLHDHLVDLLLDAAAMGRAHVEREGVSVSHAARFLLVGTMNPEEGELRPQLLDRFGLTVDVRASRDPAVRVEVVRRRLAADADPVAFAEQWRHADLATAAQVVAAQHRLATVVLGDGALRQIAEVCAAFDVDGMRADIVIARTALAHAAWQGREQVLAEDVAVAARLALPHRRRRTPFEEPGIDQQTLDEALQRAADTQPPGSAGTDDPGPENPGPDDPGPEDSGPGGGSDGPDGQGPTAPGEETSGDSGSSGSGPTGSDPAENPTPSSGPGATAPADSENLGRARLLTASGVGRGVPGRRSRARTGSGRTTSAVTPSTARSAGLHLPATIRAAAPQQVSRGRERGPLMLRPHDVRAAVREGREANLVLFLVDASGSMGARHRMQAVKGAVVSLLTDAYQRRDSVALIAFRAGQAQTLLPATSSVEAAVARLRQLPTGGRTPLAEGLHAAAELVRVQRLRDPDRRPLLVVVTDGRATAGDQPLPRAWLAARSLARSGVGAVVVDCESGPVRLGLAARLAVELDARHVPLAEVTVDRLTEVAGTQIAARATHRGRVA